MAAKCEGRPTHAGQRVAFRIVAGGLRDLRSPLGTVLQIYGRDTRQTHARAVVRWDNSFAPVTVDTGLLIVVAAGEEAWR